MKKPKGKSSGRMRTRTLDPRRGPARKFSDSGRREPGKSFSFAKLKVPLIMAAVVAAIVVGIIVAQPALNRIAKKRNFEVCRDRLMEMRTAMENHRVNKGGGGYEILGLYSSMGMGDYDQISSWVGEKCDGKTVEVKYWDIKNNIRLGQDGYHMTGYPKGNPTCLITVTPDKIWPASPEKCGEPAPF